MIWAGEKKTERWHTMSTKTLHRCRCGAKGGWQGGGQGGLFLRVGQAAFMRGCNHSINEPLNCRCDWATKLCKFAPLCRPFLPHVPWQRDNSGTGWLYVACKNPSIMLRSGPGKVLSTVSAGWQRCLSTAACHICAKTWEQTWVALSRNYQRTQRQQSEGDQESETESEWEGEGEVNNWSMHMSHAWQSYAVYEAITLKSPKPSCVYETFAPAAQATCNSQRQL